MAKKEIKFEVDASLLSDEEIAGVHAEVAAEAEKEAKDAARKQLKTRLLKAERAKKGLEEQQVDVTVDLAPYCDRILIDNVAYLQGVTYTVPASKGAVLTEVMQRTWGHQSEVDGKSKNFYQRTRNTRFSMATGASSGGAPSYGSGLMRA